MTISVLNLGEGKEDWKRGYVNEKNKSDTDKTRWGAQFERKRGDV
jgi:hypothetical protein